MAIAGIAIIAVCAYLIAGWRIAIRQLPRAWASAREAWSYDDTQLGSVKGQTLGMFLFWPVYLTVRRISDRLGDVAGKGDPVALARKVAERDERIAQLERELGIPRKAP